MLNLEVEGKRRIRRPKTRWMDVIQKGLVSSDVSEDLLQANWKGEGGLKQPIPSRWG